MLLSYRTSSPFTLSMCVHLHVFQVQSCSPIESTLLQCILVVCHQVCGPACVCVNLSAIQQAEVLCWKCYCWCNMLQYGPKYISDESVWPKGCQGTAAVLPLEAGARQQKCKGQP
jgi:hypothetical protein